MQSKSKPLLLYVEDEIFTQHAVEELLLEAGYDVRTASDGREAMDMIALAGADLDALVTDVDLGHCPDGWAISREARRASPGLPVVYMSGASAHVWDAMGVPGSAIVNKPCWPEQVVTALDSLLATAGK